MSYIQPNLKLYQSLQRSWSRLPRLKKQPNWSTRITESMGIIAKARELNSLAAAARWMLTIFCPSWWELKTLNWAFVGAESGRNSDRNKGRIIAGSRLPDTSRWGQGCCHHSFYLWAYGINQIRGVYWIIIFDKKNWVNFRQTPTFFKVTKSIYWELSYLVSKMAWLTWY